MKDLTSAVKGMFYVLLNPDFFWFFRMQGFASKEYFLFKPELAFLMSNCITLVVTILHSFTPLSYILLALRFFHLIHNFPHSLLLLSLHNLQDAPLLFAMFYIYYWKYQGWSDVLRTFILPYPFHSDLSPLSITDTVFWVQYLCISRELHAIY